MNARRRGRKRNREAPAPATTTSWWDDDELFIDVDGPTAPVPPSTPPSTDDGDDRGPTLDDEGWRTEIARLARGQRPPPLA